MQSKFSASLNWIPNKKTADSDGTRLEIHVGQEAGVRQGSIQKQPGPGGGSVIRPWPWKIELAIVVDEGHHALLTVTRGGKSLFDEKRFDTSCLLSTIEGIKIPEGLIVIEVKNEPREIL